jgi:hypothetical protein
MKKANLKLIFILLVFAIALACEQDNFTDSEMVLPESDYLKSVESDTSIADVPDIVVNDSVLSDLALVSQYRENLLTYTYDKWGRLECINYAAKAAVSGSEGNNAVPRFVYMRDKFLYNNTGRLVELQRSGYTEKPQITRLEMVKLYKYNAKGQLEQIITRRSALSYKWDQFEFLYYDQAGNMIRKLVKAPDRPACIFSYLYDRSNRLITITGFSNNASRLRFRCDLFYDNFNNIERKEFYYPLPWAVSVNDVVRKWVVYYKYDNNNNPFRDLKLPVSSLFEWMDLISPSNIRAVAFDNGTIDRMVFYKYRYNALGYPILRYRISPVEADDWVIRNNS